MEQERHWRLVQAAILLTHRDGQRAPAYHTLAPASAMVRANDEIDETRPASTTSLTTTLVPGMDLGSRPRRIWDMTRKTKSQGTTLVRNAKRRGRAREMRSMLALALPPGIPAGTVPGDGPCPNYLDATAWARGPTLVSIAGVMSIPASPDISHLAPHCPTPFQRRQVCSESHYS